MDCGPPSKKIDLRVFEDSDDDISDDVEEVTKYLQMKVQVNTDILIWWKDHSSALPGLSVVARQVLAIPAASAASERSFSAAGNTITSRRTSLDPDNVDNILFVHSNLRM